MRAEGFLPAPRARRRRAMENFLFSDLGSLPVKVGAAAVAGFGLILSLGFAARRGKQTKNEPEPKPRPVSIETELQRDVKSRWKKHKQPFLYKT